MLVLILAVILGLYGVVALFSGKFLIAVIAIVAACLIGPGGYSITRPRR